MSHFFSPRLGVVVDKAWNYLTVPDQPLDSIKTLSPDDAILAPWKFCSGDDVDDAEQDVLGRVIESIDRGDCSGGGSKINNLAWDVINAKDVFGSLPEGDDDKIQARFVMTNGGLTMFSPAR